MKLYLASDECPFFIYEWKRTDNVFELKRKCKTVFID